MQQWALFLILFIILVFYPAVKIQNSLHSSSDRNCPARQPLQKFYAGPLAVLSFPSGVPSPVELYPFPG
jgi:hypothetical protein